MASEDSDREDRTVLSLRAPAPDSQWAYGSDLEQTADVYLPQTPNGHPLVLVHGGFWRPEYDRAHLRPLASALARVGHPVLSVEYRRIPGEPAAALDDLALAVDRLALAAPPGWPTQPATIIGHSAGGHLALLLAASGHPSIGSVVALAPVADLALAEEFALDVDAVVAFLGGHVPAHPEFDPITRDPLVPVTIVHGARDSLVPLALAKSYSAAHRSVRVMTIADIGHFELIDPRADAFVQLLSVLGAAGIE